MIRVPLDFGDRAYDVTVGAGARHLLRAVIPATAERAALVTQEGIPVEVDPGVQGEVFSIGPGEAAKTLATVEDLCRRFARFGLTRRDVVVAVGGGVVTDTAGFAAAVYHRGVTVVHVPTTLLGQVDAAIGGKTGVNLAEGKNLVGSFWQPGAVLCDTEVLDTLDPREYRSGCGEMAKYHFLGREGEELEALALDARVARSVQIKASFVTGDERELLDGAGAGARTPACLAYEQTPAPTLAKTDG
ncbi:MAG: 3-dehydroquinate synthase, partial [Acidimicrobiales bacterium]